jgi:alpha-2-macroglobulin
MWKKHKFSLKARSFQTSRVSTAVFLFLILTLLVSACRPSPGPAPTTPSQGTPSGPAGTPDGGLAVVDSGEPLPPQIIERSPSGGRDLPLSGEIALTFDQPMDMEATAKALQVKSVDGKAVTGSVSWTNARTLRFSPASPLETGAVYLASLSTTAASQAGLRLREPLSIQFNTVGSLQVSQVFPAPDSKEVTNEAVVTVIFNRPVAPLVVTSDQSGLPHPLTITPEVQGRGEWINTSVYAFRPSQPLHGATTYSVAVSAGLQDASGDTTLESDYVFQFTTIQPQVSHLTLSNGLINPDDFSTDIRLNEIFTVGFYQPMNRASVESSLSLVSANGEPIPLTTTWDDLSTQIVITPTRQLAVETRYRLYLDQQAQAADGGSLRSGIDWTFTTVQYPRVLRISPGSGTVRYEPYLTIYFASPMKISSLKDRVQINPAPARQVEWWYNEWENSYSGNALQPSTEYEIRVLAGAEDIYGNRTLEDRVVRFTTGPYEPSARLQLPYSTVLLRSNAPETHRFFVSHRNANSISLEVYRLTPRTFAQMTGGSPGISSWDYAPPPADLIWSYTENSTGRLNQRVLKGYIPTLPDGSPLTPGFYFLTLRAGGVSTYGRYLDTRVFAVVSANLTMKSNSAEALFWLTDLETGQPLSGIPVNVYDQRFNQLQAGVTDGDGLVLLNDLPEPSEPYSRRFAMTSGGPEGEDPFAFSTSGWDNDVPRMYEFGIYGSFFAPISRPSLYAYTDRPIYRPGQPVYFKGILRYDDDLDYSLPPETRVRMAVENFNGLVYETELDLNSMGTFSSQFSLDREAALGQYYMIFTSLDKKYELGSVTFNVAEYRKPDFQVDVSASPEDVLSGQSFQARVDAEYYSGGPVTGANVVWTLTSSPFTFEAPRDYSGYTFKDYESDGGYDYRLFYDQSSGRVIATGAGTTGADGSLAVSLLADLSSEKTSRQLTFESTVVDLAYSEVTGRTTVVAHQAQVYPGARAKSYVGRAGQEQVFELVALDWNGAPVPGQILSVEINQRVWYSTQEQDTAGNIKYTWTVEDVLVASFPEVQVDSRGLASVSFVPPEGGAYRAVVTALDTSGNQGRTAAYIWIAGDEYIPWRQSGDHSFELIAGRTSYTPGETAEILIASPFEGTASALVTVERGRIRYHDVIQLNSNSLIYELPITTDMAPNIYVSVLIVKGVDARNPYPNYRMGVLELQVDRASKGLLVEVTPDQTTVGPGEQVRYTVTTRDNQGNPVSAEVSLSLSDLATLSLADPNTGPILDYFYSERTLGVWTAVPINLLLDAYNIELQDFEDEGRGGGSGGGKGVGDLGVVEIREDFPDTAYWEGHIQTSADGTATVVVTLPDNLTTWRMDARAVTSDTLVGQTTVDIVSSRPLLVRPQTPRFLVARDQVILGAAVHNNTDQDLDVTVSLSASGLTLDGNGSQVVTIPAHRQALVTWTGTVDANALRVDLIFRAEGGGYSDTTRPPQASLEGQGLPVYSYAARETVGTSGQLSQEGTLIEGISLPQNYSVLEGELVVKIAPSLAGSMTDGLTYLENFPFDCVEQTVSRFLPNVLTIQALRRARMSDPALEAKLDENVNAALQRLYRWQRSDGGWSWWSDNTSASHVMTSAYATLGLIEARAAGYPVDENVLARALGFLSRSVRSISDRTDPEELNRQSFVLYVLARGGSSNIAASVKLYDQRQAMALYARAYLAHTLYLEDAADERIATLLSDFNTHAIVSATGTHWEEKERDWRNWNTNTRSTAIILSVLSRVDPGNPLNANAVRWLMSNRTEGHWDGTQETAWSLMALSNWMDASRELEANYRYAVGLNGERIAAGSADAATVREVFTLGVDLDGLAADQLNRLAIARDAGPGNLYYTVHMNATLPVQNIQPVDEGIVLSRSYYRLSTPFDPADLNTPVADARVGELLLVRLTIVATRDLHYLVVNDPLPAGLEAVDQSLKTSRQTGIPAAGELFDVTQDGWGWWFFNHRQFHDHKVELSAAHLPAGTYVYTYVVRASTAGAFQVIPVTAQEFYFPEVYGRGAGMEFIVVP